MRSALKLLSAIGAIALTATPVLAEDQLYQGTECESNTPVIRTAGRTLNTLANPAGVECPAIHNPPLTVTSGSLTGFDGSAVDVVRCALITRKPDGAVLGFQSQSTNPPGFTGQFTFSFGAIPTAADSSVGYICVLPGMGPAGPSGVNQYFVSEI